MDSYKFRHGISKSQLSLRKILQIIASHPSKENEFSSIPPIIDFQETKGLAFDLNMELFPWPDESDSFSASSTTAAGGGGKGLSHDTADGELPRDFAAQSSSEGECDPNTIQAPEKESEAEIQQSVGENVNEEEFSDGGIKSAAAAAMIDADDEEGKRKRKRDCFSLLIEAAEMINCDSIDKEEKISSQSESLAAAAEVLPVARSKRRRSQVLPSRYRDSVIEPWKRRPRTVVSSKRGKFNK